MTGPRRPAPQATSQGPKKPPPPPAPPPKKVNWDLPQEMVVDYIRRLTQDRERVALLLWRAKYYVLADTARVCECLPGNTCGRHQLAVQIDDLLKTMGVAQ